MTNEKFHIMVLKILEDVGIIIEEIKATQYEMKENIKNFRADITKFENKD